MIRVHRFTFSLLMLLTVCSTILYSQEVKYSRIVDVLYGRKDGLALTMDVFQPEKPNGIGVVLLISAGWYSAHDKIDSDWLDRIKQLLVKGETVFAIVHSSMPKYKIPDIQKDIERAVRFIRYNAKKWNIHPEKLGIVGHSSGGHLSLFHAATATGEDSNVNDPIDRVSAKVNAVACFYPPTDFLYFGAKGINALSNPRFQKFLPAFLNDVKDTTGLSIIAEKVSPIKYVTAKMPPTLIITGTEDKLVPYMQSKIFIDKLNELNVPCKLILREGKDHGWIDIAEEYKIVAEWFEKYLN